MFSSEKQAKNFAEEASAVGNYAEALERWTQVAVGGHHPGADIYCIRYLALTGHGAQACCLAEGLLSSEKDVVKLSLIVSKLYIRDLGKVWVAAFSKLLKSSYTWPASEKATAFDRFSRADFLFELPHEAFKYINTICKYFVASPVTITQCGALIAYAGARFGREQAERLEAALEPSDNSYETACIILQKAHSRALVNDDEILSFVSRFGQHDAVRNGICKSLGVCKNKSLLLRIFCAELELPWSSEQLALGVRGARLEYTHVAFLAKLFEFDGEHQVNISLLEQIAVHRSFGASSLAFKVAALADRSNSQIANELANSLCKLGFRALASVVWSALARLDASYLVQKEGELGKLRGSASSLAVLEKDFSAVNSVEFLKVYASALLENCCYSESFAVYSSLQEGETTARKQFRDIALAASRAGAWDRWEEIIRQIEDKYPTDPWAQAELLRYETETTFIADDKEMQSRLILTAASSTSTDVKRVAAKALPRCGNFAEASNVWSAVSRETEDILDNYQYLVSICELGDFERALSLVETLLERWPGEVRFYLKKGQLYERLKNYGRSLSAFENSLLLSPQNTDAQMGMARALTYLDAFKKCEDMLEGLLAGTPDRQWIKCSQTFLHVRRGKLDQAEATFYSVKKAVKDYLQHVDNEYQVGEEPLYISDLKLKGTTAESRKAHQAFSRDIAWLREGSVLILGNSNNLRDVEHGPLFDRFDRVVRLNDYQLNGYEKNVGSRTDLWISSARRYAQPGIRDTGNSRVWVCQDVSQHLPNMARFGRARLGIDLPDLTTYFPCHVHSLLNNLVVSRPTTGFLSILAMEFAMNNPFCIAGFDFFHGEEMHYFQSVKSLPVGEMHCIDYERDFVNQVLLPFGNCTNL